MSNLTQPPDMRGQLCQPSNELAALPVLRIDPEHPEAMSAEASANSDPHTEKLPAKQEIGGDLDAATGVLAAVAVGVWAILL
jgi:hypothetical protein